MTKTCPRLIIAASASGSGKTTITMGLIRAFLSGGDTVFPFKIGPDYLDPGFHSLCAGKPCYNLDTFLMGRRNTLASLYKYAGPQGLAVIEGVMGLYDGGSVSAGSTAQVAKLTATPVIVIINVGSTAETAGAVAMGMKLYDPSCPVAGFILNRIASNRHLGMVREAVERASGLPVLGWVPKCNDLVLPERHLGLVAAWENNREDAMNPLFPADRMAALIRDNFDLNQIRQVAESAPPLEEQAGCAVRNRFTPVQGNKVRLGVALDNAFHFYYKENLDILEELGAELLFFSPVSSRSLPENLDGIYLGGGYPENYVQELAANNGLKKALQQSSEKGMPIYAECGGLMYLARSLVKEGKSWPMVGIFDIRVKMGRKLAALGYYKGRTCIPSMLGPAGYRVSGHIFRWSKIISEDTTPAFLYRLEKNGEEIFDGYKVNNTLGSYLHIHFAGSPGVAGNFIRKCRVYQERKERCCAKE